MLPSIVIRFLAVLDIFLSSLSRTHSFSHIENNANLLLYTVQHGCKIVTIPQPIPYSQVARLPMEKNARTVFVLCGAARNWCVGDARMARGARMYGWCATACSMPARCLRLRTRDARKTVRRYFAPKRQEFSYSRAKTATISVVIILQCLRARVCAQHVYAHVSHAHAAMQDSHTT